MYNILPLNHCKFRLNTTSTQSFKTLILNYEPVVMRYAAIYESSMIHVVGGLFV